MYIAKWNKMDFFVVVEGVGGRSVWNEKSRENIKRKGKRKRKGDLEYEVE